MQTQGSENKIVILISGQGSNMQAIVNACEREHWPARVAAVVSNRPDAAGLAYAAGLGIATAVVDHTAYSCREDFDAALAACIDQYSPRAIVLAGFMRVLTSAFVQRYAGRLINIHPSLLPAFPGLRTHQRALDAGVKWHGATAHLVTNDLDHGPIVAQAVVPVHDDDTEVMLAERVLEQEHRIYPAAVRALVEGRLQVRGLRVFVRPMQEVSA
ncbi:phosphoribosylglycinamide formyltransferase [mine drainage metagenome]|uniref:phosphoribosylglycinamide formyltransferase 1 n=1 Tax=mine drainage metagenome TaxID=410659 RepID=A0A1J5RAR1_9ZZZZ